MKVLVFIMSLFLIININAEDDSDNDSGIYDMNFETKDDPNAFIEHRLIRPDSRDNITSQNSDLQNQNSIPSDNDSGIYTSPNLQNDLNRNQNINERVAIRNNIRLLNEFLEGLNGLAVSENPFIIRAREEIRFYQQRLNELDIEFLEGRNRDHEQLLNRFESSTGQRLRNFFFSLFFCFNFCRNRS